MANNVLTINTTYYSVRSGGSFYISGSITANRAPVDAIRIRVIEGDIIDTNYISRVLVGNTKSFNYMFSCNLSTGTYSCIVQIRNEETGLWSTTAEGSKKCTLSVNPGGSGGGGGGGTTTSPASVTNLSVSNIKYDSATFSWTMDLGNSSIYGNGTYWELLENGVQVRTEKYTTEGYNSINLAALKPSTNYTFMVHAENMKTSGVYKSISFTTSAAPTPASITNLQTISVNSNSATLSFDMSIGSGSLDSSGCYWELEKGSNLTLVKKENYTSSGTNRVELTGLDPWTDYKLSIYAKNTLSSGVSAAIDFKTSGLAPTINNLRAEEITSNSAVIKWDIVDNDGSGIKSQEFGISLVLSERIARSPYEPEVTPVGTEQILADLREKTLTGLSPASNHKVVLIVTSTSGIESSATITFATLSEGWLTLIDDTGAKLVEVYMVTEAGATLIDVEGTEWDVITPPPAVTWPTVILKSALQDIRLSITQGDDMDKQFVDEYITLLMYASGFGRAPDVLFQINNLNELPLNENGDYDFHVYCDYFYLNLESAHYSCNHDIIDIFNANIIEIDTNIHRARIILARTDIEDYVNLGEPIVMAIYLVQNV